MAIKMRQSTRQVRANRTTHIVRIVRIEPHKKKKTRNKEGKTTKDGDQDEAHEQMH
jgi:hypothetical protein